MTAGAPHFLSIATLRPLGPRVITTALVRVLTPWTRAFLASSLNLSCLAAMLRNYGEDVLGFNKKIFLGVDLDFVAAPLFINHFVPFFGGGRLFDAFVGGFIGAGGQDGALLGFVACRRIGEVNTGSGLLGLFVGFNQQIPGGGFNLGKKAGFTHGAKWSLADTYQSCQESARSRAKLDKKLSRGNNLDVLIVFEI